MTEIKMPHIQYLSRREASEFTFQHYGTAGVSSRTLARYACMGGGPEFHKIGNKRVGYTVEALDAWMTERISRGKKSTSEAA
jgi:predicted DNA-binding transcriptional regulator AlpA